MNQQIPDPTPPQKGRRSNRLETDQTYRRMRVAALRLQGLNQYQIAAELKISQPTVSRDIAEIMSEWRLEATGDVFDFVAMEHAKINQIESEAADAWERSKKPGRMEETESENQEGKVKPVGKRKLRTERRDGNAAFLNVRCWCVETRLKIIGTDKLIADIERLKAMIQELKLRRKR